MIPPHKAAHLERVDGHEGLHMGAAHANTTHQTSYVHTDADVSCTAVSIPTTLSPTHNCYADRYLTLPRYCVGAVNLEHGEETRALSLVHKSVGLGSICIHGCWGKRRKADQTAMHGRISGPHEKFPALASTIRSASADFLVM